MLHFWVREALRKIGIFYEYFLNKGGGSGIPKLYVKFWWPLFLAMKFTFLFLNLAKIHIFIPKCTEEKNIFFICFLSVSGTKPEMQVTNLQYLRSRTRTGSRESRKSRSSASTTRSWSSAPLCLERLPRTQNHSRWNSRRLSGGRFLSYVSL